MVRAVSGAVSLKVPFMSFPLLGLPEGLRALGGIVWVPVNQNEMVGLCRCICLL